MMHNTPGVFLRGCPHIPFSLGKAVAEVIFMAKQGMKRPDLKEKPGKMPIVPQIQGKAKSGKVKANPIIAGTVGASQKVWHTEQPISDAHGPIDNDLARDNLENDLPFADLQDL